MPHRLLTWLCTGLTLLALLLPTLVSAQPAPAQARRVALVVGNGQYANTTPLPNPVRDAELLSASLQRVGFEVQTLRNAPKAQMERELLQFARRAQGASVALVYFAGHGLQMEGRNYLLPVDVKLEDDMAVSLEAIELNQLLRVVQGASTRLVVLDACRNNPFSAGMRVTGATRSVSRGLARVDTATRGTLIAFSTSPDDVAADGNGQHSPFAQSLAKHITQPGLEIRQVFTRVRADVLAQTGERQIPWENSSLLGDLYLAGAATNPMATVAPEPVTSPNPPQSAGGMSLDDLKREQATREEWSRWQQRMRGDFDAAVAFTGSADLRVKAWERFLAAWAQNNPFSSDDETLRAQAQQRLGQAQSQARGEADRPSPQPTPLATATTSTASGTQTFTVNGASFRMVNVPAGSFLMGSPESELGRVVSNEGPQRRVTVRAFQLGQTEVTQGLWQAVMGSNPSRFKNCGSDCPVEQVSWDDVQGFIQKLNQQTGQSFRLPSEAEWEYAARAGSTSAYPWGAQASHEHANYGKDQCCGGLALGRDRWENTAPVSQFPANAFGLHDMHGNVDEWVQDCYGSYSSAPTNGEPVNPSRCVHSHRGLRGGSWFVVPQRLRSFSRGASPPDYRHGSSGFRLARTAF
jgi:formylglycine-generating enzyme required for sulfatase activity